MRGQLNYIFAMKKGKNALVSLPDDRAKITAKENVFTLSIEKVAGADSGQYTCRVTNANNETATCSAQLEVHQRKSRKEKYY